MTNLCVFFFYTGFHFGARFCMDMSSVRAHTHTHTLPHKHACTHAGTDLHGHSSISLTWGIFEKGKAPCQHLCYLAFFSAHTSPLTVLIVPLSSTPPPPSSPSSIFTAVMSAVSLFFSEFLSAMLEEARAQSLRLPVIFSFKFRARMFPKLTFPKWEVIEE